MNSSTLLLNGNVIDKVKTLQFIADGEMIQAVKLVKEQAQIGLKEAKDVVDMLKQNPDFEFTDDFITTPDLDFEDSGIENNQRRSKKGSHIIKTKPSNKKTVLILFLLITFGIIMYFLFLSNSIPN